MKREATLMFISLLLVTVCLSRLISISHQSDPTESHGADAVWIEPSSMPISVIGMKFNVTIYANVSSRVASWEFKLLYIKNHLNATQCGYTAGMKSEFFSNVTTIPQTPQFKAYNSTHDYVQHAEVWGMFGYFRNLAMEVLLG